MKRLVLIPLLLATTTRAELTWKQTAGITCLAGAGLLAVTHPKTVYNGAVTTKKFVQENPGKTLIGLTTLGAAFLAKPDDIKSITYAVKLVETIKKLFICI